MKGMKTERTKDGRKRGWMGRNNGKNEQKIKGRKQESWMEKIKEDMKEGREMLHVCCYSLPLTR